MKKRLYHSFVAVLLTALLAGSVFTSCSGDEDDPYVFQKEDIRVEVPQGGFTAVINQPFKIEVESVSDEGMSYEWLLESESISRSRNLEYTFTQTGEYTLLLKAAQGNIGFEYSFPVTADYSYHLKEEDIKVETPQGGFVATINQLFRVEVTSVSDEGVSYKWLLDDEQLALTKNLEHMFEQGGTYGLELQVSQGETAFSYNFIVVVEYGPVDPPPTGSSAYITKVLDFMPAVGQFTNELPLYEEGDTQESMNAKVLRSIGNNNRGMISLGGFGGYVIVGFDHTIVNVAGKRDFRVLGNAFYANANPDPLAPKGGSCEPGVIMVAYDANSNGIPDDNEWYEIAGSAHVNPMGELWYSKAVDAGNDVNLYTNYEITYHKPAKEPGNEREMEQYIRWEDNKGNSGYKVKNIYHNQCYYPLWATGDKLTFRGTCLPQNAIDESGQGTYYVLYQFRYGYADNGLNLEDDSCIDIDWAVNDKGQKVNLPGVDFIKIYTGVNQENGWLGECSTEVTGVEDLHILGVDVATIGR